MDVRKNILGTIGNTPLVKINHLFIKPGVEIYAKIEGVNPSGSIKDRIAGLNSCAQQKKASITSQPFVFCPFSIRARVSH